MATVHEWVGIPADVRGKRSAELVPAARMLEGRVIPRATAAVKPRRRLRRGVLVAGIGGTVAVIGACWLAVAVLVWLLRHLVEVGAVAAVGVLIGARIHTWRQRAVSR